MSHRGMKMKKNKDNKSMNDVLASKKVDQMHKREKSFNFTAGNFKSSIDEEVTANESTMASIFSAEDPLDSNSDLLMSGFNDDLDMLSRARPSTNSSRDVSPLATTIENNEETKESYLRTTVSSINRVSQHEEAVRIKNSFSGVHFSSVKSLPAVVKPGTVLEKKQDIAKKNVHSPYPTPKRSTRTDGFFSPLKYEANSYKKEVVQKRDQEEMKRIQELSFSRKPFTYSGSPKRLKNEDIFGNDAYVFPSPDPGKGNIDLKSHLRADFADGSKFLHGPFSVSGRNKQNEVSRNSWMDWCREIHNKLKEDWYHLRFSVKYSENEETIIAFDTDLLRNKDGSVADNALAKYMTQLSNHGIAAQYGLRKRGDQWRFIEYSKAENEEPPKQTLVFVFAAPWTKGVPLKIKKRAAINERLRTRNSILLKHQLKQSDEAPPT